MSKSNQPYVIEGNLNLILPEKENKIYLRTIRFDGTKEPIETYEELIEKSILIDHVEKTDLELLQNFLIISFSFKTNNIYNILKNGIKFNNKKQIYRYLGHSNSKLRDSDGKSCILMPADSNVKVYDFLEKYSLDFSKIENVEKQAKRISQLFSRFNKYLRLNINEYKLIKDVQNKNYIFTDGCGFMSTEFAKNVQNILNIKYLPSVCQIRYRGFKGVLMHVPELTLKVNFRESMKKFDTIFDDLDIFGIVGYSQNFRPAYLNTQIIMLLESIGVPERYLQLKQKEYFDILNDMTNDYKVAINFLSCFGYDEFVKSLQDKKGIEKHIQTRLIALKKKEIERMYEIRRVDKIKFKNHIMIPKSRLVYGVCDPYGLLNENECFFQPTLLNDDQNEFNKDCENLLIARNPCYSPGDIRMLKLAKNHLSKYGHLFDCIVFSVKGERSLADQMSGGDLDGDQFSVFWDIDLLPRSIFEPSIYKNDTKEYVEYKPDFKIGNIIEANKKPFEKQKSSSALKASNLPDLLLNSSPKSQISCDSTDNSLILLSKDTFIITYPVSFICQCGERFDKSMKNIEATIQRHFQNFHPTIKHIFKCSLCDFANEKYRSLSTHFGKHDKNIQLKDNANESSVSSLSSYKSNKTTSSVNESNESNSDNNNNNNKNIETIKYPIQFTCCSITFDDKTKSKEKVIAEHFLTKHNKSIVNYSCSNCNKEFDFLKSVALHFGKCKEPQIESKIILEQNHKENVEQSSTQTEIAFQKLVDNNNNSILIIDFPVNFICICNEQFKTSKNSSIQKKIDEHFKQNHKNINYFYRCKNCENPFDNYLIVSSHYGLCIKNIKMSDNNKIIFNENKKENRKILIPFPIDFTCICGVKFGKNRKNREKIVIEHCLNDHKNEKYCFQCSKCKCEFDAYDSVLTHYESCKFVEDKISSIKSDLQNEMNKLSIENYEVTYPINFTCFCGTKFGQNRKNKKDAVLKHFHDDHSSTIVTYKCSKCDKTSKIYDDIESHFQLDHSIQEPKIDLSLNSNKNKQNISEDFSLNLKKNKQNIIEDDRKDKIRDNIIKYFSNFDTSLVGTFDYLFMKFASIKGPECKECVDLNKYLSLALDNSAFADLDIEKYQNDLRNEIKKIENENKSSYIQRYKAWTDILDATQSFVNKNK